MKISRTKISIAPGTTEIINECLRAGNLATGPHLHELAEKLSDKFNKKHVILTSNCFGALFLSLKATNAGKSKFVYTGAMSTCFAGVNAIQTSGNKVKFLETTKDKLSVNSEYLPSNEPFRLIIPHHFGLINSFNTKDDLQRNFILHDIAQAAFSAMKKPELFDNLAISFYPTKWLNGIDGGAFLTNDDDLAFRVKKLASYDNQYELEKFDRYNFKLSNINAAIALKSLNDADNISYSLKENYEIISKTLILNGFDILKFDDFEIPTKILIRSKKNHDLDTSVTAFRKRGISASRELLFLASRHLNREFPISTNSCKNIFSIPLYPFMRSDEVKYICESIEAICG